MNQLNHDARNRWASFFVVSLLMIGAPAAAAETDWQSPIEGMAAQVQELLGVPERGSNALQPLEDLVAEMNNRPHAFSAASLLRIADALLAGVKPGELSRHIMHCVKVSTPSHLSDDFTKPYGTYFQRSDIRDAMRDFVCKDESLGAESRMKLARAAVVLAIQDHLPDTR